MMEPYVFGIRHLSPGSAWHLLRFLEEKRPKLVLIELPCDFDDQIKNIVHKKTRPPIALMAYTKGEEVRTLVYPLAEYSPEYQALLWCEKNKAECRFIDLPSDVFLALQLHRDEIPKGEEADITVYECLECLMGEDGQETFWERTLEHAEKTEEFHNGVNLFGKELRAVSEGKEQDWAEILVREAYMRRKIKEAVERGFAPEEIVVVTGAYHVEGLLTTDVPAMTQEEVEHLPRVEASRTMLPYSYDKLSNRSGYGAGNRAPSYYEMLWKAMQNGDYSCTAKQYLTRLAIYQRWEGNYVSPADVIDAVRLSESLAYMRGGSYPALRDIRDAAITCIGKGNSSVIQSAMMEIEIEKKQGQLPERVIGTSVQADFYRRLAELKLERFYQGKVKKLKLDLRGEGDSLLDLHRSFFLNQLNVLGIFFGRQQFFYNENMTWMEIWECCWNPHMEIKLVEAAIKGDTTAQAVSCTLRKQVEKAEELGELVEVIETAFACGMPETVRYVAEQLQAMAVDEMALKVLAETAHRLSTVIRYGTVRKLDVTQLYPLLHQIFYRICLCLPEKCNCKDEVAAEIISTINLFDRVVSAHGLLKEAPWLAVLSEISRRVDLNPQISGFVTGVLLERNRITAEEFRQEMRKRLSLGVSVQQGTGWFEGLSMKNRQLLIGKTEVWKSLDDYISGLDEEEFKQALVVLRRAFSTFTSDEKADVAEQLGVIWEKDSLQVSEMLNATLSAEDLELIESLNGFHFEE